jgi:ABC-type sugar transport system ATPase subunit
VDRPVLALRGITKRFGIAAVLSEVDLDLYAGEVHALVGENGAGKSTLMRIAAGIYQPDSGAMLYTGLPYAPQDAASALRKGVAMVHQELSLAPDLAVAENIFAGKEPARAGIVRTREMRRCAKSLLTEFGLDVDPAVTAGSLSLSQRQLVELVKAKAANPRVLILDEPTSALESQETKLLLDAVRRFAQSGVAVAFISHRLEEVLAVSDRITVLRDGHRVVTWPAAEATRDGMVAAMVGREGAGMYPARGSSPGEEVLRVEGLTHRGAYEEAGFRLHRREILGFAGLVGSGRTELMRGLIGADPVERGDLWFCGKRGRFRDVAQAVAAGVVYLPEDRRSHGLFLDRSLEDNIICASLDQCSRYGTMRAPLCRGLASRMLAKLDIRARGIDQEMRYLSGGNQQKVLLARWLATAPSVLIVDEPTRGVDVGAKAEIHRLLRDHAEQGAGVIVVSSEMEEVLGLSDRIVVMREGRVAGELDAAVTTDQDILSLALGEAAASPL